MSVAALTQALASVPFLKTLGIRVEETRPGHLVLRLPYRADLTNHAGALHTGTVFTLGELTSAVALATHPELAGFKQLQKSTKIKYYLPSSKDITAHCTITKEMVDQITEGMATGQANLELTVKVLDGHGQDVAELASRFTFRP